MTGAQMLGIAAFKEGRYCQSYGIFAQGETRVEIGAGAPPVAALGIIGQVASRLGLSP